MIIKLLFKKWNAWGKAKCIQSFGGGKLKERNPLKDVCGNGVINYNRCLRTKMIRCSGVPDYCKHSNEPSDLAHCLLTP
jgi:hypothetical protein